MVTTVCPICRDVVHVRSGYIVRHGSRIHGIFRPCAGSGSPICMNADSCCG